jgi:hypothetical protein
MICLTLSKPVFMNSELKQILHQLVDQCNDEFILDEARAVLESNSTGKEFWDELDDEDKDSFLELEDEHEKGHSITHQRLKHQMGEWKKK